MRRPGRCAPGPRAPEPRRSPTRSPRHPAATASSALVLALAMLLPAPALGSRTIGLSAGTFDFSVGAGHTAEGELIVMNEGDEPMEVLVYAADQEVDETGDVSYTVPNRETSTRLSSPATWVRISMPAEAKAIANVPYLELAAGERVEVRFSVQVPSNAPPGDHQILLFFEMFDSSEAEKGATSKVSGRLGSRLKVRVQGDIVERFDAQPFWVRGFVLGDRIPYAFTLRNEGNVDKRVEGTLVILDGNESARYESVAVTSTTVYAGTNREFSGVLRPDSMLFGRYTARLTLEYPAEGAAEAVPPERIVKDRTVWVVPLWFGIALAVLLGLLALWVSWRGAVRAAERRTAAARRERRGRGRPIRGDRPTGVEDVGAGHGRHEVRSEELRPAAGAEEAVRRGSSGAGDRWADDVVIDITDAEDGE